MSWTPPGRTAETHSGMPPGVNSAWMLPPKPWALPEYQRSISRPFLLMVFSLHRSAATTLPSRIRYGRPCSGAFSSASRRPGAPGCQHPDGFVQVPVGGGLGDPEAVAEPGDIGTVPEPGQGEDCLFPAGQRSRPAPGADLAAVIGQQVREERGQLDGHVEHDTIGQHAEPPGSQWIFSETSSTGGSAPARGSCAMSACLPARPVTAWMTGSPLLRKPHCKAAATGDGLAGIV